MLSARTVTQMSVSVVRLERYTRADRDEITGGDPDPAGVAPMGLAWRAIEVDFGVEDEGRLVGHAGMVPVSLSVGGVTLRMAGLGGVVVAPGLRRKGLARRVVTAVMDHARGLGLEFGILFCRPHVVPFYERLGWRVVRDEVLIEQPDGLLRMPLETMWTPLTDGAELPRGRVRFLSLPM